MAVNPSSPNETPKEFTAPPEIKLHFLDYWRIIRIRKTVILAVFLLVSLTTTLVTLILPEAYSSTARIQVEKDTGDIKGIDENRPMFASYDPFWVETEFQKIQSKPVLYKVIDRLDLVKKWSVKYKDLTKEYAYLLLKGMTRVNQARNTSLIEIQVISEDKAEAALLANSIADTYADTRRDRRKEITKTGIAALEKKLKEEEDRIALQQKLVNDYRDKYQISEIESSLAISPTLDSETLRKIDSALIESRARYEESKARYDKLDSLTPREKEYAAPRMDYSDPVMIELLGQRATYERKIAENASAYGESHPEAKAAKAALEAITNQITDQVKGIMTAQSAKLAGMKKDLEVWQKVKDEAVTMDIKKSSERRPFYAAKRELESMMLIRERMMIRIKAEQIENEIPKQLSVELVEPAEEGLRPVKPNKTMNISAGIILGLLVGMGLAFFIEYLDTSVKTIDDVERTLQAPVMGVIPQNVGLIIDEGPDSPHAEAYRVLRTNVLFSRKDPTHNALTVISAGAGEGKTTTLFNLATVFAQNGQRVIMVDSDLRRPSIHRQLKVSNTIGLTSYLLKQNTLEEVIQTTSLPTLDFMPSGKLPSSSMGILSSIQMKDLVRELKSRYDFVFFDSPPIMGVSDASILASEVDLTLQVIQYRRYPQSMTVRARQMIQKVGANFLGIVLNNINISQDENYYYYSGYYYDYYSKSADSEYGEYKSGEYKSREYKSGEYRSKGGEYRSAAGEYKSKSSEYGSGSNIVKDAPPKEGTPKGDGRV